MFLHKAFKLSIATIPIPKQYELDIQATLGTVQLLKSAGWLGSNVNKQNGGHSFSRLEDSNADILS